MSAYTYLASSKEMVLPEEMEQYNRRGIFDNAQISISLNQVNPSDEDVQQVQRTLTQPYMSYLGGLGHEHFWRYLDKYMEMGDVLEMVIINHQHKTAQCVRGILEYAESVYINVGRKIYRNKFGAYQLHNKIGRKS